MSASGEVFTPLPLGLASAASFDLLAEMLARARPAPIDVLQIAALLETTGITDIVAQRRYGFPDVFALAQELWIPLEAARPGPVRPAETRAVAAPHRQLLRDLSRGPLALVPMVFLSLMVAVYQGVGRWPPGHILALSLAMVSSLLVTSGFVQAASRKGASYLCQGYVKAAWRIVVLIVFAGLLAVGASAIALACTAPRFLPAQAASILVFAFVVLSLLWLGAGVLFLLGSVLAFGFALAVGVASSCGAIVVLMPVLADRSTVILAAAVVGSTIALAMMALAARRSLTRHTAQSKVDGDPVVLPPWPHLAVGLTPYFVYGIAYVALILAGHAICWISAGRMGLARVDVVAATEAGLTFALAGYIMVGGVAEHTVGHFWTTVQTFQRQASPTQLDSFCLAVRDFFVREKTRFAAALLVCNCLVTLALAGLLHWRVLPWSMETNVIFALGLCGYGLIGLAMFDCMFMVTLSRPSMASGCLAWGIACTLIVGLALGHLVGYPWTTLAVPVGGLVLVIAVHRQLHRVLAQMDYCYYASF